MVPETGMSNEEILESVADALLTLANVGYGDYTTRLKVEPEDMTPLASLYKGINEMIVSLSTAGLAPNRRSQYE